MTRSLPHYHTITKTFHGVLGVEIWKTPYFAINLKFINTCPRNWGLISIDHEHRLVYQVIENELLIYACRFHYD
jgi:Txe/YoeB family toxin of Txe-Axe toxin-antitoxin module